MNDDSISAAKANRIRDYYEHLLQNAGEETLRQQEEEQRALLSEDPLETNYARWATEEEFCASLTGIPMRTGSAESAGMPLFCKDQTVYADPGDSHTLILGASGSKKTRLFILPGILSLCKAGESMIITDPKAELYERTSVKLKEAGYRVYCINFRDDSCQDCWNPLVTPRQFFESGKFDLAVGLLNDFSAVSIPRNPRNSDPFWDEMSRGTFMGLLLYIFLLAEDPDTINIRSLLTMRHTIFAGDNAKDSLFRRLYNMTGTDSVVRGYLSGAAQAPDRTFSSILSTLDSHLLKFLIRPSLTDMLCRNDIDFQKIGREKTAVFLVMPDEKETYHGLVSIFIQQCYEMLIFEAQKEAGKKLPVRVNFLLDEFSSLPQIKEFPSMIAAARSRNIRFNIVVQSEKQLVSRYGDEADTIMGNCNNWVFLYSRELRLLQKLSDICSTQKSGRPLITVSRLQRLSKESGEVLVIQGRSYPFLSHLEDISRYDDEHFTLPEPHHADWPPVRTLHVDDLFRTHTEAWLAARLNQERAALLEAERQEQEAAEKRAGAAAKKAEAERQTLLNEAKSMASRELDWLPLQPEDLSRHPLLKATGRVFRETYADTAAEAPAILSGWMCRPLPEEADPKNPPTAANHLPPAPFPLNTLSLVAELNRENLAFVSEDPDLCTAAALSLYHRTLSGGQMIPLYLDMRNLKKGWAPLIHAADRTLDPWLLCLLLAADLYSDPLPQLLPDVTDAKKYQEEHAADFAPGVPSPLGDQLKEHAWELQAELSRTPAGRPEYLVILNRMDTSESPADAIWQAWNLGSMANVQLAVTLSNRKLLTENCVRYLSVRNGIAPASKIVLYFDDGTNEVLARQAPAPALCLEAVRDPAL